MTSRGVSLSVHFDSTATWHSGGVSLSIHFLLQHGILLTLLKKKYKKYFYNPVALCLVREWLFNIGGVWESGKLGWWLKKKLQPFKHIKIQLPLFTIIVDTN